MSIVSVLRFTLQPTAKTQQLDSENVDKVYKLKQRALLLSWPHWRVTSHYFEVLKISSPDKAETAVWAVRVTVSRLWRLRPSLAVSIQNLSPRLFRLQTILNQVSIQKKKAFVELVLNYWTLKRQSRNGLPLIRRLQTSTQSQKNAQPVCSAVSHTQM